MPAGIAVYDRDERLLMFNAAAAEATPTLRKPGVIGMTYEALAHETARENAAVGHPLVGTPQEWVDRLVADSWLPVLDTIDAAMGLRRSAQAASHARGERRVERALDHRLRHDHTLPRTPFQQSRQRRIATEYHVVINCFRRGCGDRGAAIGYKFRRLRCLLHPQSLQGSHFQRHRLRTKSAGGNLSCRQHTGKSPR